MHVPVQLQCKPFWWVDGLLELGTGSFGKPIRRVMGEKQRVVDAVVSSTWKEIEYAFCARWQRGQELLTAQVKLPA